MAGFLSSAPLGLNFLLYRNRWFAQPASFHPPSGLHRRGTSLFRPIPNKQGMIVSARTRSVRAGPALHARGSERRALPENLARIIELQPWRDCTNIKAKPSLRLTD